MAAPETKGSGPSTVEPAASDVRSVERFGTPVPGAMIADKYRVDAIIGAGGMGVVVRATHLDLQRAVAIKVIRPEHAQNEEVVARTVSEARLVARLKSEHVARVLDVGRLDTGLPFIVMELLEGIDLYTLLEQRGQLPIAEAVDAVMQAAEAVAEAHVYGIVHRDLKPENLFLADTADGSNIVKVLDFGISKDISAGVSGKSRALTNPTGAIGSPHYMAPEQMRGAKNIDSRADIWALGVILFELMTGRVPFDGETLPLVCAGVLNGDPPDPRTLSPEIPVALAEVILRCLRKNADERYSTVDELATHLAKFGGAGALSSAAVVSRLFARSTPSPTSPNVISRVSSPLSTPLPRPPAAIHDEPTLEVPTEASRRVSSTIPLERTPTVQPKAGRGGWVIPTAAALVLIGGIVSVLLLSRNGEATSDAAAPSVNSELDGSIDPSASDAELAATEPQPSNTAPSESVAADATTASAPSAVASAGKPPQSPAQPPVVPKEKAPPVKKSPPAPSGPVVADPWNPSSFGGRE